MRRRKVIRPANDLAKRLNSRLNAIHRPKKRQLTTAQKEWRTEHTRRMKYIDKEKKMELLQQRGFG